MIATDMAATFGQRHASFSGAHLVVDEVAVVPRPVCVSVQGVGVPAVCVQEPLFPRSRQQRRRRHRAQRRLRGALTREFERVRETPVRIGELGVARQGTDRQLLSGEGRPASVYRLGTATGSGASPATARLRSRGRTSCGTDCSAIRGRKTVKNGSFSREKSNSQAPAPLERHCRPILPRALYRAARRPETRLKTRMINATTSKRWIRLPAM